MSDGPLMVKSKAFALDIIRICNAIHEAKHESILTKQLVRSGTSIGANIREAFLCLRESGFYRQTSNRPQRVFRERVLVGTFDRERIL